MVVMYHSILYALTRGLFFFLGIRGFDILSASLSFFSPDEYCFLFFYGEDSTVHPGATNCLTNPIFDFLTEE